MSLKRKIYVTFALLFLGVVVPGIITQHTAKTTYQKTQKVIAHHAIEISTMQEVEIALLRMENAALGFFDSGDSRWLQVHKSEKRNVVAGLEQLRKLTSSKQKLNALYLIQHDFNSAVRKIGTLIKKKRRGTFKAKDLERWSEYHRDLDKIYLQAEEYGAFNKGQFQAAQKQAAQSIQRSKKIAYVAAAVSGVACLLALFFFTFFVARPAGILVNAVHRFGKKGTFEEVPVYSSDELGELARTFNKLGRDLSAERIRLKEQALRDELTNVYNMRYFRQKIEEEFARAGRYGYALSLLMIDVDHFKTYNDTHGHPMGDVVLKDVANVIVESVRETDVVCRYGGEEFTVLLLATDNKVAQNIAEKIRVNITHHAFPKGESQPGGLITISVGVTTYREGRPAVPQGLVNLADKALYLAKVQGRNRVCVVDDAMGTVSKETPVGAQRRREKQGTLL